MKSIKRRAFLKHSLKVGAGLSCMAFSPGRLLNFNRAFADDLIEEKLAKYSCQR